MTNLRSIFSSKTGLCFSLCLLCCACHNNSADTPSNAESTQSAAQTELPKTFTADISGDYSQHFVAVGDEVNIGLLPTAKKGQVRFNVDGTKENSGGTISVSTGISNPFAFTAGIKQDTTDGRLGIIKGEEEKSYNEFKYRAYFDTTPASVSVGHITLTRVDKMSSKNAMLVRYHLIGTFNFDAANAPEPPSQPCSMEAAQHGGRLPPFNADLCGAKKIHVNGSFDVVQDFPASAF